MSFDSILNFRDIGQTINEYTGQKRLKPGLFFRSARPDEASGADRKRLKEDYGIKTIIDLRTTSEQVEQSRRSGHAIPAAPPATPSSPAEPLKIPGIAYHNINFNGPSYSRALIKQLTWSQTMRLGGLYTFGYRKEAISVLGTNVMAERGLTGLAKDSLEHCKAEVKQVFELLADAQAYPLLVHCTQGKDRTGLVVLLVLMLLGVPTDAIESDYRLSEMELKPERASKLEEIRGIGLPDSFADCPVEWVDVVSGDVNERFSGVEAYLTACSISELTQQRVKARLAL